MKKIIILITLAAVFSSASADNSMYNYARQQASTTGVALGSPLVNDTSALQDTIASTNSTVLPVNKKVSAETKQQISKTVANAGGDRVRAQAFASTVNALMPMTPDQIRSLHQYYRQTKNAVNEYPGVPPRPTSGTQTVDLSPGATPPTVRMSNGFISTLNFLDATGQPWPITGEDLGDPKNFNVQVTKSGTALLVQSLSDSRRVANLAVMLKGLSTPVMVTLLSGQAQIDYRMDFRVPKMGPDAKPQIQSQPNVETPQLLSVLDGIPPKGSSALQVSNPNMQAWAIGNQLYIRTRMTVISPSWVSSMQSGDGTHAYQMPKAAVILAMQNGQIQKINIGDAIQ